MSWKSSGTVNLVNGEDTVNGNGLNMTAGDVFVGETFLPDGPGERAYEITSILSDNSFTIAPPYYGTNKLDHTYRVQPGTGFIADAYEVFREATAAFSKMRQGIFENGISVRANGTDRLTVSETGIVANGIITGDAVMQSVTDETKGRLMVVGAYGNAGHSLVLTEEDDLFDLRPAGTYRFSRDKMPKNCPGAPGVYELIVRRRASGVASQYLFRHSTTLENTQAWTNSINADGPNKFERIYDTGLINGTISFDGDGDPDGALFESNQGTTGNIVWEWEKSANRTMQIRMLVPVDVTNTASPQVFALPESFAASAIVGVSVAHPGAPNQALELDNLAKIEPKAATVEIQLKTAGASTDPNSAAEKLVLTLTGRAA